MTSLKQFLRNTIMLLSVFYSAIAYSVAHSEIKIFDSQLSVTLFCATHSCWSPLIISETSPIHYAVRYTVSGENIYVTGFMENISGNEIVNLCSGIRTPCFQIDRVSYNNFSVYVASPQDIEPGPKDPCSDPQLCQTKTK